MLTHEKETKNALFLTLIPEKGMTGTTIGSEKKYFHSKNPLNTQEKKVRSFSQFPAALHLFICLFTYFTFVIYFPFEFYLELFLKIYFIVQKQLKRKSAKSLKIFSEMTDLKQINKIKMNIIFFFLAEFFFRLLLDANNSQKTGTK